MKSTQVSVEQKLIDSLRIVSEDIKQEAMDQPTLFLAAARYRVDMMRKRAKAGAELEAKKARLTVAIRNKKNEKGEKMTEGTLKATIEKNEVVMAMRDASDRAYEDEEFAKLLVEAYRQRRDSIRIVADMQAYEGMREGAEVERIEQNKLLHAEARKLVDMRVKAKSHKL